MKWLRRTGGALVALSTVLAGVQLATAQSNDRVWISKPNNVTISSGLPTARVTTAIQSVYPGFVVARLKTYECALSFDGLDAGKWFCQGETTETMAGLTDQKIWDLVAGGASRRPGTKVSVALAVVELTPAQILGHDSALTAMGQGVLSDQARVVWFNDVAGTLRSRVYAKKVGTLSAWRTAWDAGTVRATLGVVE